MARVLLRPPTAEDRDEFIAGMRASRKLHRPWINMPETPDRYGVYLSRTHDPRAAPYLACRTEDGAIVGFLNISEIVRGGFKSAFLGYGGIARYAGQGYMTEAMRLLLREAFTTVGLHRLEANIQPGNQASIALAKRCGFELEGFSPRYLKVGGRWRDHERWAIREETWRGRRTSTAAG
jgi:ribosomal-protein-alanine N-acetyltransferase